MTAITGETGAGKSLILDALGLALGDRGDTGRIRLGANKAEVSAIFVLGGNSSAQQWLREHDFDSERSSEFIMRRSLSQDGRSRGFINGQVATMGQLRELGAMVVDIHNQHEHQSLLNRHQQRRLLDDFGGHHLLCSATEEAYHHWFNAKQSYEQWLQNSEDSAAQQELLAFQLEELEQLSIAAGEINTLEADQVLLANAESIITDTQTVLALCDNEGDSNDTTQLSITTALNTACATLEAMPARNAALEEALKLLDSARIQVNEALTELQLHLSSSQADPAGLLHIEERLTLAYQLARKHKVKADELPDLHSNLAAQLDHLSNSASNAEHLAENLNKSKDKYLIVANKLSKARKKAALNFTKAVNKQLSSLAMGGATIQISRQPLAENTYGASGLETIELLISTNPGQPHRPLNKVASGGELSRISLAIQVIAAEHSEVPVLVFDEVDVGVGGATASVIGKLLKNLGAKGQIICISHQPQVASCAQYHWLATKSSNENNSASALTELKQSARTEEIARMLGGEKITEKTRSHAKEMLEAS